MIVVESRCYNLNRILLLVCGLWPYENTKFRYVRAVFIFGILTSFIVDKLITLFVQEYNFKLALKILSDVLPIGICALKFLAFLINTKKVKQLLDLICREWSTLKDSEEIEIAKAYGKLTRRMTTVLLLYGISSWFVLVMMQFIPVIIDNFATANKSLPRQNDITPGQFGEEKYIYALVVKFTGVIVITATITMILAYMRHICMMLRITCYRIEHSMDEYISHMSIRRQDLLICRKLISAVNIQRRAMEFCERAISSIKYSVICLIAISVISLAINLLHTLQAILDLTNINELLLPTFYVLVHFIYIFVTNYGGQLIIDHSADVFKALCEMEWYTTPVHVQKLILFLMVKNTKSFGAVIGGLYVASLESFVTLTSTSISYFMVIYSTQ